MHVLMCSSIPPDVVLEHRSSTSLHAGHCVKGLLPADGCPLPSALECCGRRSCLMSGGPPGTCPPRLLPEREAVPLEALDFLFSRRRDSSSGDAKGGVALVMIKCELAQSVEVVFVCEPSFIAKPFDDVVHLLFRGAVYFHSLFYEFFVPHGVVQERVENGGLLSRFVFLRLGEFDLLRLRLRFGLRGLSRGLL